MVYRPTSAVPNIPTHFTLHTQPIEMPVSINQMPHSGENGSGQRDAQRAEGRIKKTHESVVQLLRVGFARLKLKGAIVTGHVARQADQHFAERRVDVEVKLALEVVRAELAKMRLIPRDDGREANLPHAREEGKGGEYDGTNEEFLVIEHVEERIGLHCAVSAIGRALL